MEQTMGQRLAEQRKKIGLTQNELAEKLMISNKAVSKWESDNGNPSIEFLPALSKILQCSIDYLLTGNNYQTPKLEIPITFDFYTENQNFENLIELSHTIAYCDSMEDRDKLYNAISKKVNEKIEDLPVKIYCIDKTQDEVEIQKTLSTLHKKVGRKIPLAAPLSEWCKHESEHIFPATFDDPFIIILVNELNEFLLNKEYERYFTSLIGLGKASGIYVVAINTKLVHKEFKKKFKTTVRFENLELGKEKLYAPIFLDQIDFDNEEDFDDEHKLYNLPLSFGYKGNKKMYFDAESLIGTLITGETGSGKSNLLHHLITQISTTYKSSEVQLALIDAKCVEFYPYFELPNLYSPVARNKEDITKLLKQCVDELDRRYDYLMRLHITDRKVLQDKTAMPYLIIIIDEVLELTDNAENLQYIQRILQLGRACGMFMYIASQSQIEKQIPRCITANIATKISFKLRTKELSKHYLDTFGAEELNEKGTMIIKPPFKDYMTIKVPYLTDSQIKFMVENSAEFKIF